MVEWAETEIIQLAGSLIVIAAILIYLCINQRKKIIEWLKYAVSDAEKQLGGGTGQLKLRLVYDSFCEKFPIVAALLPFKVFSSWVDTALDTMKEWLEHNSKIGEYIKEA